MTEQMQRLHALLARIAPTTISVLILGETGVGKEVFARRLHALSTRAKHAFVAVNCGALSETLLESELFGHEKGAFTGADRARVGLLESADQGTVFLDEIGDMPHSLQTKLLRVIEQREVLPVGSTRPRAIDVRFIAATHKVLIKETFRPDLYFRLNGAQLHIPPLRERPDELRALALQFAHETAERLKVKAIISPEVLAQIHAYAWPGNIRELRSVIERMVLLAEEGVLRIDDMPTLDFEQVSISPEPTAPAASLHAEVQTLEQQRIEAVLLANNGNQTRTAKALGISRGTLASRLDAYGTARPRKTKA